MKTPKQKLIDHLQCYGWDIEETDENDLEWWEDESWLVKSHWKPQESVAYITALVDPEHDGVRKKGQHVWAYGLAKDKPNTYQEAQSVAVLRLGKTFKECIDEFIDKLIELRDASDN